MIAGTDTLHDLVREIDEAGFLQAGHFGFRSGKHALRLLDRDRALSDTHLASRMGYGLAKEFFLSRADIVATPSIWGAGLAQWVGFFLEPRRPVVYATNGENGGFSEASASQIDGRRVLVVDNLILTGETIAAFLPRVERAGGTVIGIGALADLSSREFDARTFGLLNDALQVHDPADCPACRQGVPLTEVGY